MTDTEELDTLFNRPIAFGLEAQGHIKTIEAMLVAGQNWQEIGTAIGWDWKTAKQHYSTYQVRFIEKNIDKIENMLSERKAWDEIEKEIKWFAVLKNDKITDEGNTFMRLSYSGSEEDYSNNQDVINIVNKFDGKIINGALVFDVDKGLAERLCEYIQAVLTISSKVRWRYT